MSILNKLASSHNRADEVLNELLAKELIQSREKAALAELVAHLADKDKDIASDCIKVLYEIGAAAPELIADYVDVFIALLNSHNNRLVWGAMTALGAIADLKAHDIWRQIEVVINAVEVGSVITQDWGIRVLAVVSANAKEYEARIFPFLMTFIKQCRPKDVPRHAESILVAVNAANRNQILPILETRKSVLRTTALKRLEKVIQKIEKL